MVGDGMARWNAKLGPARLAQQCFCRYRTAPCGEARGGTREQAFDDAAIPSGMGGISAVLSRRGTRTPLGAFAAADAHYCIMVRISAPSECKDVGCAV